MTFQYEVLTVEKWDYEGNIYMRLVNIKISNFRGIKNCDLNFPERTVLVGDNNSGKSTILEAIDLVLGPERLSRRPVIDEHDF